ncbi:hypothetical protein DFH05DRAFT_468970 [Lentinula detonsa]|uniref:YtkA-like domain-containing protein n=1 Tax=Lentinula detonsa TaxID=2804962 RepID=A0A9W8TTU5_9AGAR|nr:hypothetical protein DFH05DRAFT_468970 [Lentinula detonsa]
MRLATYLVLGFVLVSAAFTAPLTTQDTAADSHIKITIIFEGHDFEGIHTHLTTEYTAAIDNKVMGLVGSIVAMEPSAPAGLGIIFAWIGTPSPDASKPVKYDVSTEEHGRYKVVMSHKTPLRDFIVTDTLGRLIKQEGDPFKNP